MNNDIVSPVCFALTLGLHNESKSQKTHGFSHFLGSGDFTTDMSVTNSTWIICRMSIIYLSVGLHQVRKREVIIHVIVGCNNERGRVQSKLATIWKWWWIKITLTYQSNAPPRRCLPLALIAHVKLCSFLCSQKRLFSCLKSFELEVVYLLRKEDNTASERRSYKCVKG